MIIRLTGEVDDLVAPTLRDRLAAGARAPTRTFVVVDLSAVTFMNCAGLGPLLEARARLGERLWLRRPARPVRRLLALLSPFAEFDVVEDATLLPGGSLAPGSAVADEVGVTARSAIRPRGGARRPVRSSRPVSVRSMRPGCAALAPPTGSRYPHSR